jgi:hypothetical protein
MTFEEQAQRVTGALPDRVREHVARELHAATDELSAMLTRERAADEARTAEQLRLSAVRAAEAQRVAIAAAETRGRDAAHAAADRVQWAASERLLDDFRRLDEAQTLTDVLDGLADAAVRESPRVAVLTVSGGAFDAWRTHGLDPSSLTRDQADVLGDVVRSGRERFAGAGAQSAPVASTADHDGRLLILPIKVGDAVVALVCADPGNREKPDRDGSTEPSIGPSMGSMMLELLTRHAGRALEAVTAARTAQLMKTLRA